MVIEGTRPKRPSNSAEVGLSDEIWAIMQACWEREPTKRPKIGEVVKVFAKALNIPDLQEDTPDPASLTPLNDGEELLLKVGTFSFIFNFKINLEYSEWRWITNTSFQQTSRTKSQHKYKSKAVNERISEISAYVRSLWCCEFHILSSPTPYTHSEFSERSDCCTIHSTRITTQGWLLHYSITDLHYLQGQFSFRFIHVHTIFTLIIQCCSTCSESGSVLSGRNEPLSTDLDRRIQRLRFRVPSSCTVFHRFHSYNLDPCRGGVWKDGKLKRNLESLLPDKILKKLAKVGQTNHLDELVAIAISEWG